MAKDDDDKSIVKSFPKYTQSPAPKKTSSGSKKDSGKSLTVKKESKPSGIDYAARYAKESKERNSRPLFDPPGIQSRFSNMYKDRYSSNKNDQRRGAAGPKTARQKTQGKPTAADTGPDYSTLEELIANAMAIYGKGSYGNVDRSGYDAAGAKIAAMYKQLEGSYGADAEALKNIFADASSGYAANASNASNSINQAYSSAQAERMRQLQALGIQESAAIYGDSAVRDQASAVSNIARMLEAAQGRNTGYQNAALTLNEQMKGVARAQGAAQQAAIQQAYADAVANSYTPGIDVMDALSIAKSQMAEQDKMIEGLTPAAPTYGYAETQALWDQANADPNLTTDQAKYNWIRSMQRAQG